MIIEAGLCYVLYSLGEKIYRNIAMEEPLVEPPDKPPDKPLEEDEHIINMVKSGEAGAFEKESVSLEPEVPPDDPEKRYQMYVNSSLASMGLFALKPILGPLGFFPYFFGVIPYANDVKKALVEKKQVNADVLFFAADMLTLAAGNLFTAAFGLYLIHSGKLAVARAKDNSQKMVMHLFEELPREVVVIGDQGQEILTPIEAVNKGDIIEVSPGQVVPVDGVITGGMASIDQHALTGESQPSEKGLNDVVLANTIVIAGTIIVRVENSGLETTSHQVAGAIELQPTVQKGIKDLVCNLKAHGVDHLAIVSGDHKAPTKQLAKLLGMDDFFYEVLPQNKAKIVEDLQNQGRTVCFVGDGINDSMALKQADVSISLAGAFFLNFNILTSLLVNVSCNLLGMANVMPPSESLTAEEQLNRDTRSEFPDE